MHRDPQRTPTLRRITKHLFEIAQLFVPQLDGLALDLGGPSLGQARAVISPKHLKRLLGVGLGEVALDPIAGERAGAHLGRDGKPSGHGGELRRLDRRLSREFVPLDIDRHAAVLGTPNGNLLHLAALGETQPKRRVRITGKASDIVQISPTGLGFARGKHLVFCVQQLGLHLDSFAAPLVHAHEQIVPGVFTAAPDGIPIGDVEGVDLCGVDVPHHRETRAGFFPRRRIDRVLPVGLVGLRCRTDKPAPIQPGGVVFV